MKRFFSVIFISSDGSSKRQYNINLVLFRTTLTVIAAVILGVVIMAIYMGKIYSDAIQKNIYEERVRELEAEVAKIERLKKDIAYLYDREKKLQELLGIEKQNELLKSHSEDIRNIKIDSVITVEELSRGFAEYPDIWPVKGIISRGFTDDHPAVDIAATTGSPVVTTVDGAIAGVGWDMVFGNYVKIKNEHNVIFYGHLQKVFVNTGQEIRKGEIVGLVGNTGKSTAPHLHYEIMIDSILVDPQKFLP